MESNADSLCSREAASRCMANCRIYFLPSFFSYKQNILICSFKKIGIEIKNSSN